uniref:Ferredoxin n=1 Tax=Tetraselmis sp. GSL018 TaxID=582737 RepID=A0A061RBV1_9CHLO|eukprot:CAMPEP_0177584808 /NCGR_PEP_ID=MMETSP0419_2-20121207/4117_1 /TAXON_ID=582737 /ORGANISM="Tetraselmis sp., Strain GSL018" /LENGTH=354 /DNA_ID=CAMNT_0019074419 /DNA_START=104 /DNA_END=1168 /DNA_ORIENTATION=+
MALTYTGSRVAIPCDRPSQRHIFTSKRPNSGSTSGRGTCVEIACISLHGQFKRSEFRCNASKRTETETRDTEGQSGPAGAFKEWREKAGLSLGPIGLTLGGDLGESADGKTGQISKNPVQDAAGKAGVSLGPIGLTLGGDIGERADGQASDTSLDSTEKPASIASMTTEEWRAKYEPHGRVDLWVEEEFNSGSRLIGGRSVHNGGWFGMDSGEGRPSNLDDCETFNVKIYNHYQDKEFEVQVPEDRYILWEAEDHGLELPYSCRMGCCTACAVRVLEGEVHQYQALGISRELRDKGYALMCVGYPVTDCRLETVTEDEVYELQFGRAFQQQALDPASPAIERDDFALEIANMDE